MAEQIYVARVTGNAFAAGRFVAMVADEPVELSPAEADELLRVRFIVKATRGTASDADVAADVEEDEGKRVTTASLEPTRTATAAAQNAKSRKGNLG